MEHAERLGHRIDAARAEPSLGLIECSSIAKGYEVADAVAKESPIELLWARTVSGGSFVILFAGDVAETTSALDRGVEVGADAVADHMLIANVHRDLAAAIRGPRDVPVDEALGIVELSSVPAAVLAADRAVKAAHVELLELRLAMHMSGKGFFLVAGEAADVEEAVAVGAEVGRAHRALVRDVVIPRVSAELLEHLR